MKPALLQEIGIRATRLEPGPERVARLRQEWPELHFSHCLDDEVGAGDAAYVGTDFNLYLVSGNGGCACLTGDVEAASGLVVADVDDD